MSENNKNDHDSHSPKIADDMKLVFGETKFSEKKFVQMCDTTEKKDVSEEFLSDSDDSDAEGNWTEKTDTESWTNDELEENDSEENKLEKNRLEKNELEENDSEENELEKNELEKNELFFHQFLFGVCVFLATTGLISKFGQPNVVPFLLSFVGLGSSDETK